MNPQEVQKASHDVQWRGLFTGARIKIPVTLKYRTPPLCIMAANFWLSSHCKNWLLDRDTVLGSNAKDSELFTPKQLNSLRLYFIHQIQVLGKSLKFRPRVIGSAVVFFRRFYLKYVQSFLVDNTERCVR
jgi:hypothetical protein